MGKIQNTFSKGTVNKDVDSRFLEPNELIDAENFFVNTVDGSSLGVGKNALGNAIKTTYSIVGAETVGHGVDSNGEFIYNFIKGTNHDYIIEYNCKTSLSVIVCQSTTGTLLNFKSGERIVNVRVIFNDEPYNSVTKEGGNLLSFSGDSNPPRILNINRAKTWGVNGFTIDEIMLIKAPPRFGPSLVLSTSSTLADSNFIKEKFLSFAYRYKYKDGYYSAISSWSEYAFDPNPFKLDYQTFENLGMVNKFNTVTISFNTGKREVVGVDLLFKQSNSSIVFVIDKFIKQDELWADNSTQTFEFNNSKNYSVLPEDQYFRSYDNVPLSCVAQSMIGNRIGFANYKEQRDLLDKFDNKVLLDYSLFIAATSIPENSAYRSLHSNRDYEIGIIYLDEYGRKTTVLTSSKNTIHIGSDNSNLQNKIIVQLVSNPPKWADRYKFVIKESKKKYEIFYSNVVYADGIYRWIKIDGGNRNKIKEGDVLIAKSDYSGIVNELKGIKVLEVKTQEQDFVIGNVLPNTSTLVIEEPGTYFKMKPENLNIDINGDSILSFIGYEKRRYTFDSYAITTPVFSTQAIKAGSRMSFSVRTSSGGSIAFDRKFEKNVTASTNYTSIKDWFDAEIGILSEWTSFRNTQVSVAEFITDSLGTRFRVRAHRQGTQAQDIVTEINFTINYSGGSLIFETTPEDDLTSAFYELPETYTITNGLHDVSTHTLNKAFNCYSFGNGVESYQIKDSFNEKELAIDFVPTAVSNEEYKSVNRFADITYSGVFNSSSNVNKLNEFNLYTANFKDDIDKSYGPIYKLEGLESNLQVFQEDKDSFVYYGKDILYNADGTSNLSKIDDVLGLQDVYIGEYGISTHAESFDIYAGTVYHSDVKRGVVLKKVNNGLFEISSQGMNNYFKKLFRDNTINRIIGKYDQHHDVYVLNIKYNTDQFVTWVYSDNNDGWMGRISFNPEDMCRVNGKFFSFKNGEIYEHNQSTNRNTFYGVQYPSTFEFNYSQMPSERKNYKAIEIEGTDSWELDLATDLDSGYINKTDFVLQEGVYRAYTRNKNTVIDTSKLSCQGIGNCTVGGLVLTFGFDLDPLISVGDDVRSLTALKIGKIVSKTNRTLTLDAVVNFTNGDFVMCSKPQSVENSALLGYHMVVKASLNKNTKTEVYAINSEIVKSYS